MAYGGSGSAVGEHCGESAREAFRDNRAGATAREWIFGGGDGGNRREIAGKTIGKNAREATGKSTRKTPGKNPREKPPGKTSGENLRG